MPTPLSRRCAMELCRNWTGQGCACEVLDVEPDLVDEAFWADQPQEVPC